MKSTNLLRTERLASLALVFLSVVVLASPATGQGGTSSDRLKITLPSGAVLFDQVISEALETDSIGIGFFQPPFSGTTVFLSQVLALTEPGTSVVSDRVWVQVQPAVSSTVGPVQPVNIFMCSDSPEGVAPPFSFVCPTNISFTAAETGTLQNVTSLFTILSGSGLTIEVQSEIETVPEPGTLIMLSSGLVGLMACVRRRHRRS